MKDVTSRAGYTKARQIALWIIVLAAYFVSMTIITKAPFGLSTNAAQAVSGGSIWSIIVLIVGNRAEIDFLRPEDHVEIYRISVLLIIQFGPACLVVFPGGLQDHAWAILMLISILPCLALATIVRRALFSAEEWAAASRKDR